jgi:hypothetical protein
MAEKKIVLRHDGPCPCGSGKTIINCHLGLDGRLRKPVPSLRPPGPKTSYAHPGCYLRSTADCSRQISREHYISEAVLEQLGRVLRVSGAAWLPESVTKQIWKVSPKDSFLARS